MAEFGREGVGKRLRQKQRSTKRQQDNGRTSAWVICRLRKNSCAKREWGRTTKTSRKSKGKEKAAWEQGKKGRNERVGGRNEAREDEQE